MLQAHGAGCVTPAAANVASLTTSQLAVGQLPSMQQLPQIRDPEWLKVEVCREFQRGACKRTADECRYAHPGKNIQVSADGKVIACFDALKVSEFFPLNDLKLKLFHALDLSRLYVSINRQDCVFVLSFSDENQIKCEVLKSVKKVDTLKGI
ncbi:unnamed protein product [Clavelina lepadiformis]|uniref:C3H1-type domain-containing protein n=1 Tax=Clavelina lepadiformis TaxID=159417 RepID=A0ABP0H339_CLALP